MVVCPSTGLAMHSLCGTHTLWPASAAAHAALSLRGYPALRAATGRSAHQSLQARSHNCYARCRILPPPDRVFTG
eukprot:9479990-Alexandrium_andersonii.AAC.1